MHGMCRFNLSASARYVQISVHLSVAFGGII